MASYWVVFVFSFLCYIILHYAKWHYVLLHGVAKYCLILARRWPPWGCWLYFQLYFQLLKQGLLTKSTCGIFSTGDRFIREFIKKHKTQLFPIGLILIVLLVSIGHTKCFSHKATLKCLITATSPLSCFSLIRHIRSMQQVWGLWLLNQHPLKQDELWWLGGPIRKQNKTSNHEEYGPVVVRFLVGCSLLGSPRDAHVSKEPVGPGLLHCIPRTWSGTWHVVETEICVWECTSGLTRRPWPD